MTNNEVKYLYSKENDFDQKLNKFLKIRNTSNIDIEKTVLEIINQIKISGDRALITMIKKFDKISCSDFNDIKIENKLLKKLLRIFQLILKML